MRDSARAWLDRTDARAAALVAACEERREERREGLEEQHRRAFVRECEREGIDPAKGVSPSLLKLLGERDATDAEPI